MMQEFYQYSLREKCLYSELFRSVFSRIRTEYGEILPTDTFYAMQCKKTLKNKFECLNFATLSTIYIAS